MPSIRRTIPFYRRILPWIFAIVFLAVAPALIFFTSGYRWNSSKGQVERNGTVILDSAPREAKIVIDGRLIADRTPVTLQDVSPGLHTFTISKDGFFPWEKALDVRPERVTFANDVWLWKTGVPEIRDARAVIGLTSSDDERLLIEFVDATTTNAIIADTLRTDTTSIAFPRRLKAPIKSRWSSDNRHLLVESPGFPPYVLDARSAVPPVELTAASYRWENTELVGVTPSSQIRVEFPSFRITREILAHGTVDAFDGTELRIATGSAGLVYFPKPADPRGFVLPTGSWLFAERNRSRMLFNADGQWLSLQESGGTSEYRSANGDRLRLFHSSAGDHFLLVNNGELWLWDPQNDPELLYRQSDPILAAAWHHTGNDVFFATSKNVYALNLDQRDGRRLTPLASFDRVSDMIVFKNDLLIAGEKDGKKGVWTLVVE